MSDDNEVVTPVRAAIVGYGDVSVVHAEAIAVLANEGACELAAVCDSDPARADAAHDQLGAPVYTDIGAMLRDAQVDVVHITTPHDQHVDAALAALSAGVDVICEKPIANSRAESDRFVSEVHRITRETVEAGRPAARVGICLQNRYNNSSTRLAELLNTGALGEVQGAYASVVWTRNEAYYQAKPWRGQWDKAGGGLLVNQALHTLDLVQWLMGPVTDVRGRAASRVYGAVSDCEDTAEAVFEHENGTRTTFFGTLTAPRHRSVELEITGTLGTAAVGPAGLTVTMADGSVTTVPERLVASSGRSYWGLSHEVLIRDFYAGIGTDQPFWISPAEGAKCLEMAYRIYDQSDFDGFHRVNPR